MSTNAPNIIDMVTDCANDTSHNPYSHFAKIILKGYLDGQPGKVTTIYELLATGRVNGNLVTRSTFIQVGELLESGIAVVGESSYRLESIISLLNDEEASLNEDDYGKPGVKFWSIFTVQLSTTFYRTLDIAVRNAAKKNAKKPKQVAGAPTPVEIPSDTEFDTYSDVVKKHFIEAAKEFIQYWNSCVKLLDTETISYLTSLLDMHHFERLYMQSHKAFNGIKVGRRQFAAYTLGMSGQLQAKVILSPEGKSAYEIARENGFQGTEVEFFATFLGPVGPKDQFISDLFHGYNAENFKAPINQLLFKVFSNPLISVRDLMRDMVKVCGLTAAIQMLVKLIEKDVIILNKYSGKPRKPKGKAKILALLLPATGESVLLPGEWDHHALFVHHDYHPTMVGVMPPGFDYQDGRPKPPQKSVVVDDSTVILGGAKFPRDKAIKFHRLLVLRKQLEEEESVAGLPEWFRELGFDYTKTWDRVFDLIPAIEKTGCIPVISQLADEKPLPSIE